MTQTVFAKSYSTNSEFSDNTSESCSKTQSMERQNYKQSPKLSPIDQLVNLWKRLENNNNNNNRKYKLEKQNSVAISFLGTVIPNQTTKNSPYRLLQHRVFEFLHRPHSLLGFSYHIFVFLIVFICLIVTILTTIRKFENLFWNIMMITERVIVVWFTGEFIIRLWASSCRLKYRGWRGKLRYLCSPLHFVDLIVIIVSITVMWVQKGVTEEGNMVFAASAFRGFHRFFQMIRITRTERQFKPFRVLLSVLYAQREQLIIITYIAFLVLSFAAFLLYLAEKGSNEQFESIADSFWWAVVTLFTIGYGDKVPVTWFGKLIATFFIMFGVSIFTIPAGILGAGLAINIQHQKKHFQNKQKLIPAALLIQSTWRLYASHPTTQSTATWNIPPKYDTLSTKERNAIRFIRLLKFLRNKRIFKSMFSHKDINDLIEQNRREHLNMMFNIKDLKNSLDKIQDNCDSKQMIERVKRLEVLNQELMDKFDKQFDHLFRVLTKDCNKSEQKE